MLRRFSTNFGIFSIGFDAFLAFLCLFLSSQIRPSLSQIQGIKNIPTPVDLPVFIYIILPIFWIVLLLSFSLYDGRRLFQLSDEITNLTTGSLIAIISQAGFLFLTYRDMSRAQFLVYSISAYLFMLLWRLFARHYKEKQKSNPMRQRRVIIIGASDTGLNLYNEIKSKYIPEIKVIGFIDDDIRGIEQNITILGHLSDANNIAKEMQITDAIITLPSKAYNSINQLVSQLHNLPLKIWIIPDYFHLALHKAVVEDFAGFPMFDLRAPALDEYQRMVKRIFDLVIIISFLPIALFTMALISLAIYIESRTPIFFRQLRVGENGKLFHMWKFRTMVPNAENLRDLVEHYDSNGSLIHKSPNDPRVTQIGRLLRKTSLDELPQLYNILKSEMSLVGPRPELPYLVENYQPWQRKRFTVPPGITGWWQVNGRSDKPMHLHTEDDLYYVHNYSIILDIKILIKTIWVVLLRKGAF